METAVDRSGGRLTAGDAAAATGLPLPRAEAALAALAADVAGRLLVSAAGDVVYELPPNFRAALRARSALLRLRPAYDSAVAAAGWAARAAFGAALLASVALVWAAVFAASTAGDDRDRRGGRSMPFRFYLSPADLWFWFDPSPRRRRSMDPAAPVGPAVGFLEAVFDFVFGGPDPNARFDDARWAAATAAVRAAGGVVTAEQLAPYLDEGDAAADDESFVVPALVRFGGHADVDDAGGLLYSFPELATSAGGAAARERPPPPALEAAVPFTRASPGQRAAVIALAIANAAGVASLGGLMADAAGRAALVASGFGPTVFTLFPFLQLYSAAFFVVPAARWLLARRANEGIAARNDARLRAAAALAAPGRALAAKLASARRFAAMGGVARVVAEGDVVFDSGVEGGTDLAAAELDAFDAKLRRARGEA